ncbi:MAG TPA: hypothetical protein VIK68_05620 [Sphingomicrobium sp.]
MNFRILLIAAATSISGSAFAAEAPKVPVEQASQPQRSNPPIVLASTDIVPTPTPGAQQSATPVKHRVARVTTCRCGDQPATDPEGQPEQ